MLAQSIADPDRFEVASIKPSSLTGDVISFRSYHGGLVGRGVTLAFLVENCFPDIRSDDQIVNAPKWFFSAAFDVEAKPQAADLDYSDSGLTTTEKNLAVERIRSRLRVLLEDRFALKAHRQVREIQAYALVVGKSGAKFVESRLPDGSKGGAVQEIRPGRLAGSSISMPLLASLIGRELREPVVDKTGLSGFYSLALSWTPDDVAVADLAANAEESRDTRADANWPSIFTAVQQQLGLRLVGEKREGVLLVIDHAERPSLN